MFEPARSERHPTPAENGASAVYVEALAGVAAGTQHRLMVPGHKGRQVPPALASAFGRRAVEAFYAVDFPLHIAGLDLGVPGETPFELAQHAAARAWGASSTIFLTGGGSQANHIAAMTAAVRAGSDRRPRFALATNVHQSMVHAAVMANAEVVWVSAERHVDLDVDLGVDPAVLEDCLRRHGPFDLASVVSPTYLGAVSDIPAIAAACRRHHALLHADEAWGAHLALHECFPTPAIQSGADLVTSSTHKVLGSATQSAMLHVAGAPTLIAEVRKAALLLVTTSPNSWLYASLDGTRAFAEAEGRELLGQAAQSADRTRRRLAAVPSLRVIDERIVADYATVVAFDPLRVAVDVRGAGLTGGDVREYLLTEHLEIEYCTDRLVVALFGIGDSDPSAGDAFATGIENALRVLPKSYAHSVMPPRPRKSAAAVDLRRGYFGVSEPLALIAAVGRHCAEVIAPYPPGIPVALPGEELTAEVIDYLLAIRAGAMFSACADPTLETVRVLTRPSKEP
jgi:arginine decarboxylase